MQAYPAMKFPNLFAGGLALAERLMRWREREGCLVLGIARGGAPAAVAVSRALDLPLDWVLMSALFMREDGSAVRAVRVAGELYLDPELTAQRPRVEQEFVRDALVGLQARARLIRGDRPPVSISGATVLLVDCGMRTGGTVRSAVQACRTLGAKHIVVAVPVAAKEVGLPVNADELICLARPDPFGNVGLWYQTFDVPQDSNIAALATTP